MRIETIEQIKAHAVPYEPGAQMNAFVVKKQVGGPYKVVKGLLCYQSRIKSDNEEERKAMAEFMFYPAKTETYQFDPIFRKIAYPGIHNVAKTRNYGGLAVDPNRFPNTIIYLSDKALFTERGEAEAYCNIKNQERDLSNGILKEN